MWKSAGFNPAPNLRNSWNTNGQRIQYICAKHDNAGEKKTPGLRITSKASILLKMWILPFLAAGARRFGQANTNTTLHTNTVNANKIKNQVEARSFPSWLQVLEDLFPSLKIQCNIGENLGTRFCVHGKKWKPDFVLIKSTVGIRFCVNRIKCDISCWPDVTPPLT